MEITEADALVAYERTERTIRYAGAIRSLSALRALATLMRPNDRIDSARAIWLLFIDGQDIGKLCPHEIAAQAAVLAGAAWYLTEADVCAFALKAWGDRALAVHCAADTHLSWWPEDETVIITRTTLNGATTVMQMTPTGVSGRVL